LGSRVQGFSIRRLGNRAKSLSLVHSTAPCSIASAARWASMTTELLTVSEKAPRSKRPSAGHPVHRIVTVGSSNQSKTIRITSYTAGHPGPLQQGIVDAPGREGVANQVAFGRPVPHGAVERVIGAPPAGCDHGISRYHPRVTGQDVPDLHAL